VINEGVGGKTSAWAATKTSGILSQHPEALYALILFGTNDSLPAIRTPSGLGKLPGNPGYSGSYKANMQTVIDVVVASGRTPVLMKVPFTYGDCSRCTRYPDPQNAPRNVLIREYNQVIDELVSLNALQIGVPDLYAHFEQHPEEMADRHHPNGIGYQSIADLLADALLGQ
jgi:lysophospholipase L1-like esterase